MARAVEEAAAGVSRATEEETSRFESRLAALNELARTLPPGSDEETQDELGLLLQLLPAVDRSGDSAVLGNIDLAVRALLAEPPNRLLAIRLREASQQTVLRRSFLRSILPGNSASTWVIAGMATLLFVAIPIVAFISLYSLPERTFTVGAAEGVVPARFRYTFVVLVAVAGAVGSVVSILVRIRDFTKIRILNPPALFWTGLFKPIIGAAFALFVFCAFGAGLIFVNPAANEGFLVLAFAFVAGFSERFAPDLVSSLERSVRTAPTPE